MTTLSRPPQRQDFEIAIICALRSEADAVEAVFDIFWDDGKSYGKASGDPNAYTTGVIGSHNVVLAYMPGIGKGNAASVASSFRSSFEGIKLALVVGICGGVPHGTDEEKEILLGDVVISDGLIQYDFGRQLQNKFVRKDTLQDSLGRPNTEIRALLAKLKGHRCRMRLKDNTSHYLTQVQQNLGVGKARYPGVDADKLFEPTYRHKHHDFPACTLCSKCEKKEDEVCQATLNSSCSELKCNENRLIPRQRLLKSKETSAPTPLIHYGLIASGDTVMKSGEDRDIIATRDNIIAFEMEGAGVWDNLPCVVIKGVCDYADSHKNKDWQGYAAATASACMKAFLKEWVSADKSLATNRASSLNPLPEPIFKLPYTKNPDFVRRQDTFERLQKELLITGEHQPRAVLWGLGGVGKSQIAIQHAYWYRKTHPDHSVFWIHASSFDRFHQGFSEIARECKVPGFDDSKANYLALIKSWLSSERSGKWLMIIDNADEADVFFGKDVTIVDSRAVEVIPLSNYIPECSHGAILVTTRTKIVGQKLARGRCLIKVLPMNKEESVELFRKQFQGERLDTDKLDELTRELEGLPLALAQAAAFIQMNSLTFGAYLKMYKENDEMKTKLLSERFEAPGRDSEVPNPVVATFMISFEHIKRTTPQAACILSLMALLDRQGIPKTLIQREVVNQIELAKALGTLKAFSLISTNEADDTFDMHRLVYLATRNWLRLSGEFDNWAVSCLKMMWEVFPSGEYGTLDTCELYLPHARAALSYKQLSSANDVYRADLAYRMSRYLQHRGQYNVANSLAEQALGLYERVLGKEHPSTLVSMSNLALVLDRQGKYKEAEETNRRTLELYERVLGKEHPYTLTSMSNLALVLRGQGKYEEAEGMHRRTLELYERVLGKEHPLTLTSMSNLAGVLAKQGKYKEAEETNRRTLELFERVLGKEHPDTLISMSNLARVLEGQGKYKEAEEMNRRTLELRERVLGKERPDTLTSMSNLAGVLDRQGKYKEAEGTNRRALELRERVLGKEHPDTLTSMSNLAGVLDRQGKYEEAEEMNRRTLELREKVLGKEHPDTLTSIYCLAYLLQNRKRYDSSSVLYQRALLGYQKKLGLNHPTTLECSKHYSSLLEEMK